MTKAFISWSGGKDCCLAVYKAMQTGIKIACLLNTVTHDSQRSCSHGISSRWIRLQSEAVDIPILQIPTTDGNYQSVFTEALRDLSCHGVNTGIFGDIDFEPHLEWIKEVCVQSGIDPILPLWGRDQNKIVQEFIDLGFTAKVVATRADIMGKEWLGRMLDKEFLQDVTEFNKDITPCGEAGEFHTLVVDGPIFKKQMNICEADAVRRGEHWFWDIKKIELLEKRPGELY